MLTLTLCSLGGLRNCTPKGKKGQLHFLSRGTADCTHPSRLPLVLVPSIRHELPQLERDVALLLPLLRFALVVHACEAGHAVLRNLGCELGGGDEGELGPLQGRGERRQKEVRRVERGGSKSRRENER